MQRSDYKNLERGLLSGVFRRNRLLSNGVFNGGGSVPFQRPLRKKTRILYICILSVTYVAAFN